MVSVASSSSSCYRDRLPHRLCLEPFQEPLHRPAQQWARLHDEQPMAVRQIPIIELSTRAMNHGSISFFLSLFSPFLSFIFCPLFSFGDFTCNQDGARCKRSIGSVSAHSRHFSRFFSRRWLGEQYARTRGANNDDDNNNNNNNNSRWPGALSFKLSMRQ
jgi:hypothetical protein